MRVSRDGGRTYPRRHEQRLAAANPGQPATVPVFDAEAGTGRLLVADFDTGRARAAGAADPAAAVAAEAARFADLVAELGGRCVTDVSQGGGRHVYVLFAEALPWRELRDVARALACRYVSADPAPMAGPGGQISPPGARHRSGGWRAVEGGLAGAVAAVVAPCGPRVWAGLLAELAAELAAVEPVTEPGDAPAGAAVDEYGMPWLPRLRRPGSARRRAGRGRPHRGLAAGPVRGPLGGADGGDHRGSGVRVAAGRGPGRAGRRHLCRPGRAVRAAPRSRAGWNGCCRWNGENRWPGWPGRKTPAAGTPAGVPHAPLPPSGRRLEMILLRSTAGSGCG